MIRNSAPRRLRPVRFAWVVVLGTAAFGLTQCRNATDRIAGLELEAPSREAREPVLQALTPSRSRAASAPAASHTSANAKGLDTLMIANG